MYAAAMPAGKYDRSQSAASRRREQRAKLLGAAAAVFAAHGYADASVEAIVVRAGMSRRTFYEHFRDLREVLLRLHERAAQFSVTHVRRAMDAQRDPVASVEAGIHAFLALCAANDDLGRVLFREVRAAGYEARREALEDAFAGLLLAGLRKAHRRGAIAVAPDSLTVTALIGALETIAMRLVEHGDGARLPALTPMFLRMTLGAFR
jgi:AcrR family transcriptional regulator